MDPVQFNATSGPSGENPTGHFHCGNLDGPVTCLNVQGNVAYFDVATSLRFSVPWKATDNGPFQLGGEPGSGCHSPFPSYRDFGFTGSIVVVDAPPLPTSKDQCGNRGWRNFPGIKSQGDCVSFVATKGKNQPAG